MRSSYFQRYLQRNLQRLRAAVLWIALMVVMAGCGAFPGDASKETGAQALEDGKAHWPSVIRYGVLPGEEEGELSRENQRFVSDMAEALGIGVELFVGEDYTAVIEAMRTGKIDIASFGPFSFVIAEQRSGAVPFAVKAPDEESAFYHSLIVVPQDSEVETVEQLAGKNFLFADPASTSGHLFPRAYLIKELDIKNEEIESFFGNVSFSGGHDKSIIAIARGDADGAAVCEPCIQRVIDAGIVSESDFRVIAKSDPIPDSPLAYRNDLPADLVEAVKAFVFQYHEQNPDWFSDGERFIEVETSDYDVVRETAKALNMSPEELLK